MSYCLALLCKATIWALYLSFVVSTAYVCTEEDATCIATPVDQSSVFKSGKGDGVATLEDVCVDRNENCQAYVERGECENNPGWMIVYCPVGCKACHLRDAKVRCQQSRLNTSTVPALLPGQLNSVFENIVLNTNNQFGDVKVLSQKPWVLSIENFLTPTETASLVGSVSSWQRSTNRGDTNSYGEVANVVSQYRTSYSAWCKGGCEINSDVQNITRKIQRLTGITTENYEAFQVLKYEPGQLYKVHHDSSFSQNSLICGTRILTVFLYLSDVEEGGETVFPLLGIEVKPANGKALIWPGVLNDDPSAIDSRTIHEALPVVKGIKYAANTWIHMYDFKTPNKWGCTGNFE